MTNDFSLAINDTGDYARVSDTMDSANSLKEGVRGLSVTSAWWNDFAPGSKISALSAERVDKAKKMDDPMT